MLVAGDQAPPFELPDLQGRTRRLADALERGPVLVVFWKSDCETCDVAFPYLQHLTDVYSTERWELLAVSQEGAKESADFAREQGLSFPVLIDGDGWPVSKQYDPEATPTLFLIAPDGAIQMTSVGFHKQELNEIAGRLAEYLGEPARAIALEDDGNPPFKPG